MTGKAPRKRKRVIAAKLAVISAAVALAGPSTPFNEASEKSLICPAISTTQMAGTLRLFSANVQDLPHGIADRQRDDAPYPVNRFECLGHIGANHDVVMLQEDFTRQPNLRHAQLPYVWNPDPARSPLRKNSGVSILSRYRITPVLSQRFNGCNGNLSAAVPFHAGKIFGLRFDHLDSKADCLASKAFKIAVVNDITFINSHLDAGRTNGDIAARQAQFEQLDHATPKQGPLVVAMDANVSAKIPQDQALLAEYMRRNNLILALRDETDVILTRNVEIIERKIIPLRDMSDHNGLSVTIRLPAQRPAR